MKDYSYMTVYVRVVQIFENLHFGSNVHKPYFFRYVKSESDRLHALSEAKRVKAHLQCAEGILESLKMGTFSTELGKNK